MSRVPCAVAALKTSVDLIAEVPLDPEAEGLGALRLSSRGDGLRFLKD